MSSIVCVLLRSIAKKSLTVVLFLTLMLPTLAHAEKFKQCVKGVTGLGFVAQVKWIDPDTGKVKRTRKTPVWDTDCYTSDKPHYVKIRAIGATAASTVMGLAAGAVASVGSIGACIIATNAASGGLCASVGEITFDAASTGVILATKSKGTFYFGAGKHIEVDGPTWNPKAHVKSYFNNNNKERFKFHINCAGKGISDEGTTNKIDVTFYKDGKKLFEKSKENGSIYYSTRLSNFDGETGCSGDVYFLSPLTDRIDYVKVMATGGDALWIDYASLSAMAKGKPVKWGKNGGMGYCASKDLNDGKGWRKNKKIDKNGCAYGFKFDATDKNAYGYR